jgi:DNA topoisomerase-1
MTSTLQQEASRKFGMGAKATMSAAQRLYEAGLITYMRTDGIDMAPEAVMAARDAIKDRFGEEYLPKSPRMYKNKAKNAQEAHECIRPTDMARDAASLRITDNDQRRLYDLIWKRTLASQMAEARLERTTVEIGSQDGQVGLRATGQVVLFEGFMAIYLEGRDDPAPGATDGEDDDARLPQMAEGDALQKLAVTPEQHFTQPPPRYTEATLVKRMEELGIGRPSTYASIVTTIQDREYVRKENSRLIPEDKGRLVTAFLTNYFRRYVEYDFTAGLEDQLDHISAGEADYKEVLPGSGTTSPPPSPRRRTSASARCSTRSTRCSRPTSTRPRGRHRPAPLPHLRQGPLSMRTARTGGAFIGCSNYPDCRYTRPFGPPSEDGEAQTGERLLGHVEGDPVWLKDGRFGPYVQRGEATAETPKPPRASLPKGWAAADMDLEKALRLLSLPRLVGPHPEDGQPVEAGIGRFGPYVKHGPVYANLPDPAEVFEIGMNRAARRPGPEGRRPGRRTRPRGGRAHARPGRPPGWRRDRGHARPLRPLREVGEGQRHASPRARTRDDHARRRPWPLVTPRAGTSRAQAAAKATPSQAAKAKAANQGRPSAKVPPSQAGQARRLPPQGPGRRQVRRRGVTLPLAAARR